MPIRNAQTFTFKPRTLIDAIEATNAAEGGLSVAQNLVPAPSTPNFWTPRPAAIKLVDLSSINAAGVISAIHATGDYVYGMIQSTTYPGKDQPFVYRISTNALLTVSGVATGLLPASLPTSGAWVSPLIFSGAGGKVMVCHSGFTGANNVYLGWFDVSNFSSTAVTGNTTTGSPIIASLQTNVGNSAPILSGYQPGYTITGPGIPAGAYILSMINGTFSLATTGTTTAASTSVTAVASVTGAAAGMSITGPNLLTGTYITVVGAGTFTLSQAAIASGAASALTITGGGSVTISANATATANGVALAVAGGSPNAPLWGAGNLNGAALSIVPTCGSAFNGRAWYGANQYAIFSDPLNPTQVTQSIQALTIGDQSPVTAIMALPLTSQLTGGIQQSLTIYKGAQSFYQVTGDATTGNLAVNAVTGSVGSLAPNTIIETPLGVMSVATDGVRILGLTGVQSPPLGVEGTGVTVPFLNALVPSRMTAAYAENTYRISIISAVDPTAQPREYWFHPAQNQWSGPHTFASAMLEAHPNGAGFLSVPIGVPGSIWYADTVPKNTSTFVENGVQLSWIYNTTLLPDNQDLSYNQVIETAIGFASPAADPLQITVLDEKGTFLDSVTVVPDPSGTNPVWGTAIWGAFLWGTSSGTFRRYPVKWSKPLNFRQASMRISASSDVGQLIGNIFVRYQVLGYGVDVPR